MNKLAQQVLQNSKDYLSFKNEQGLLLFQELIYVSASLGQKLVKESHFSKV